MKNHYKPWTMNEIRFVRNNRDLSDKEIANELGRTASSVTHLRWDYYIKKNARVGLEEIQLVTNNPNMHCEDFARITGRHKNSLYYVRRLIGAQ